MPHHPDSVEVLPLPRICANSISRLSGSTIAFSLFLQKPPWFHCNVLVKWLIFKNQVIHTGLSVSPCTATSAARNDARVPGYPTITVVSRLPISIPSSSALVDTSPFSSPDIIFRSISFRSRVCTRLCIRQFFCYLPDLRRPAITHQLSLASFKIAYRSSGFSKCNKMPLALLPDPEAYLPRP